MNNNWNPFFALANNRNKIDEAFDNRKNVENKVLTEDALYEIQEIICYSLENACEITITHFKNNKYFEECGVVKKVDVLQKEITINDKRIKVDNLIAAKYE